MCRKPVVLLVAVALVVVGVGAGPRAPVARVWEVKGKATIVETENFDRPAAIYGTVYADELGCVRKNTAKNAEGRENHEKQPEARLVGAAQRSMVRCSAFSTDHY